MIHSEKEVLDWLLAHCEHDRVLYNALTNHQAEPSIYWNKSVSKWYVLATTHYTKTPMVIAVVPNYVTREPHSYYRVKEEQDV